MIFRRHSLLATILFRPSLYRRMSASSFCSQTIMIKPSSPTPGHLTKFKLSLIDNHMAPCYVPLVFFYKNPTLRSSTTGSKPQAAAAEIFDVLKSSLAQALTRFYPLAGRLSNSGGEDSIPIVNCNDEGVPFSFANDSSRSLDSFLINRGCPEIVDSLQRFLPFPAYMVSTPAGVESAPQIAFKATVFQCGGVAVGVCLLHKIVDGHTVTDFMKLWAAIVKGENETTVTDGGAYAHNRGATWLFPARVGDVIPSTEDLVCEGGGMKKKKKNVTKRLVFSEEAISALKVRARSKLFSKPGRSEAVGGLLWKCAANAAAIASSPDGIKARPVYSVAVMAVDLRYRLTKPWKDYWVGNLMWGNISLYENYKHLDSLDNQTKIVQQLAHKLRSSIEKVDGVFVERLEAGAGREEYMRNEKMKWKMMADAQSESKVMYFVVSSLIRLGLYDVDFGWGKPVWISMGKFANHVNNVIILIDSPTGHGVEAWIALHEEEMTVLERDPDLLTFVKNDPNVIKT